ncbi:hypothetical protein SARC_02703 [Sphaeroforma arctica JP610]|uniref:SGNH hydrolase-type esterase domain-containing protein n=1 Tax=Sphaeroforma arctica JP610 TaxID=667725 RepID=A0A0L0GA51_9EUKA|nr:hypothetical protein SARC_02703 [Sphaeroforma arctica JP610]KNC85113.1 hypothetical protein SARC_02703 [Sphaeroforma arctica JP610]|eukprot:XP_014159015.1 hypothetical protein SARC_02703 [Sphaeroforma arctica JP610]
MTFLFILILHTSGSVYDMSDNKHVLPTKVKKITHVAANRDYMRNGDDDTVHVKLFEKRKPKSNDPFDATIPRWWANRPESDTFKHPHPPAHAVDGDKLVLGLETRTVFKSGNEVQCEDLDIGMSHEGRLFGQVKDLWMDDDVVLLQIGANDGRTHDDPIYKHYRRARAWRGVFLEPIPYFYNKLQRTYGQAELMKIRSLLLNYVVADKDDYRAHKAGLTDGLSDVVK